MSRLGVAFSEPMIIDDREVAVGLSFGTALTDKVASKAADLIADADQAMYRAKRAEPATS